MKRFAATLLLVAVLLLTLSVLAPTAMAKGRGSVYPRVIPPWSTPHGASYAEWGARWWQWMFSLPVSESPMYDTTGANGGAGQSGSVWFLAGTFTGGDPSAHRTLTVPVGKALFIPVINVEGSLADTPTASTFSEVKQLVEDFMDTITVADLTVDGHLLKIGPDTPYRTGLIESWYTLPVDNVLGLSPGTYSPVAYDGYYAMLAPLPAGKHVIKIHGQGVWIDGSTFDTQATYDLTVK